MLDSKNISSVFGFCDAGFLIRLATQSVGANHEVFAPAGTPVTFMKLLLTRGL